MVKILITIIFISVSLVLTGCGNDQYAIERQYWSLQRQAEKIFKNPHASPPNELEATVKSLADFAKKHPNSPLSIDAEFDVARLYIAKKEFEQARGELKRILDKYSRSEAICVEALFLMGNTYELQDQWNFALQQYKKIMREYPVTRRGLDIPVYIAQHYKAKYQPDKMVAALQEAVVHYRALAIKFPDTPLALTTSTLVAECFIALKDWQAAVDTFDNIIANYKNKAVMDNILLNMAIIYQRELKNEAKAKETLERLINEYPKSALVKEAGILLKEWSKK